MKIENSAPPLSYSQVATLVHRATRPLRGSVSCGSGWSVPCVSIQLTLFLNMPRYPELELSYHLCLGKRLDHHRHLLSLSGATALIRFGTRAAVTS